MSYTEKWQTAFMTRSLSRMCPSQASRQTMKNGSKRLLSYVQKKKVQKVPLVRDEKPLLPLSP